MKRFFTSDSESDMLIAVAANFYDLKTEELINMAIHLLRGTSLRFRYHI